MEAVVSFSIANEVGSASQRVPRRSSAGGPPKVESGQKGAKHKQKEKEKTETKSLKHGAGENGVTKGKGESEKKKKKKSKEEKKDEGTKRPLSAYMLYNNYRRPVLRKEHPSKSPLLLLINSPWSPRHL